MILSFPTSGACKRCAVEGCEQKYHSHGYCNKHAFLFRKYGNPLGNGGAATGKTIRFLEDVVFPYAGDDCLAWPFCRSPQGRGTVSYGGRKGGSKSVSRVVCTRVHGPAPTPKHEAAHSCGNGHNGCCNPRHLRWATKVENEADKRMHGTVALGARNGKAKLTDRDVLTIRALEAIASRKEIAEKFNISRVHVGYIVAGKTWRHLSEVAQ